MRVDKHYEPTPALKACNEANAHLRAVNADLLAALEEIATETYNPANGLPAKPYNELHNIARAAIAKAKP